MADWGEIIKKDVLVISTSARDQVIVPVADNPFDKCCYSLNVFADLTDSSYLKNDVSYIYEVYASIFSPTMYLQEQSSNGTWSNIATLSDSTYGQKLTSYAVRDNQRPYGYKISWLTVLTLHGVGSYRLKFDSATPRYSPEFCLKNFNTDDVDKSVRIDYTLNSEIGSNYQDIRRDFSGYNLKHQIRLSSSIFGFAKADLTKSTNAYNSGYQRTIEKNFRVKYRLEIFEMDIDLLDLMLNDILMADDIIITDYNSINASGAFAEIAVEIDGNFEPDYANRTTATPSLVLQFIDKYDTKSKKYS